MNVYDFDDTIYDGDSTFDFVKYSFTHCPKVWLYIPKITFIGLCYVLKMVDKLTFKKTLYSYFKVINNMDEFVENFVLTHMGNIKEYYLAKQKDDDLIISASPCFLVKSFCDKLGIKHVMGSNVDKYTGKYNGLNCWGEEKVRRFYEAYPDGVIDEFYSDSYSDSPLASIAKKAYIVKKDKIEAWGR